MSKNGPKYSPDNPHPSSTRKITDFMKAWKKFSLKGVKIWKSTKK